MANTITIPKTEYKRLKQAAERYETIRQTIAPTLFPEFPTENLRDYAHPERIRRSLRKALKEYPIAQ